MPKQKRMMKMNTEKHDFMQFSWRGVSLHITAYIIAALFASLVFDYNDLFSSNEFSAFMQPMTSPIAACGPFLQIVFGFFSEKVKSSCLLLMPGSFCCQPNTYQDERDANAMK